jgi:hypothetical protein
MLQKREQAPKCGSNEEEKKINHMDFFKFIIVYKLISRKRRDSSVVIAMGCTAEGQEFESR